MPPSRLNDGKFKYGGGCFHPNTGNIYCFPSDAGRVLKVEASTGRASLIGPMIEGVLQNKWQNGFLADNDKIYAIPCDAEGVLEIDPATDQVFFFLFLIYQFLILLVFN